MSRTERPERGQATRELMLTTAERLFAEQGMAVSNRQIGDAAGQANSAVVAYHFGSKTDLVRAIVRRHAEQIEQLRADQAATTVGSTDVRDWVTALVLPTTRHLAALGSPTWYARFWAQLMCDPVFHEIAVRETLASASQRLLLAGLHRLLPELPAKVNAERGAMVRHLITGLCVDRERALADGSPVLHASWDDLADCLIDAITAIWLAPARGALPPG